MKVGGLQLLGKVDRYVGSLFIGAYATSMLLIVGLAIILDLASNLKFFETWEDGTEPPTSWVLRYCALNTPFLYLRVAPFVTTAAALFTLTKLIRYNELVACLNAGISARRLLLPIFAGGALAGLAMLGLREGATHVIGDQRDALRDVLSEQRLYRVLRDVWLRDVASNNARIREFYPATSEVHGLEVYSTRGPTADLQTDVFLTAEIARWEPGIDGEMAWRLIGGEVHERSGDTATSRPIDRLEGIELTPRDIFVADKGQDPDRSADLSFGELADLSRRGPVNHE
jgi:hypothetical protein